MKMNAMKLAIPLFVALVCGPSQGLAASILGSDLASFAVLGASDVTSATVSTIGGNLGSFPTAPTSPAANFNFLSGSFQPGTQGTAQTQLDTAIGALPVFGAGTNITGGDLDAFQFSNGGFISPGTYSVGAATIANLVGDLILKGDGTNTAVWNFLFSSSLVTSTLSNVTVTNVGDGANVGLYWNVGSSATLDGDTFAGNVLASTITTDGNLTMGCGRLLAATANVALNGVGSNISTGCGVAGDIGFGSSGFDQAGVAAIPEPETYALMLAGLGLLGFAARRRMQKTVKA
jgi:ice-binding like protein/PEP-CTERM motif-containing protein